MVEVPQDITQLTDAQLDALLNLDKPRGTRNNNPGNIEDGPFARSLPGYAGTDGRFALFDTPEAGRAANDALMQRYGQQGLNTPLKIISRYAPPGENDTQAYAEAVASALGVRVNDPIDLSDPAVRSAVFDAINVTENGPQAEQDVTQLSDEELNLELYGAAGTEADPIDPSKLSPELQATLDKGMYVLIDGQPRLMAGRAETGVSTDLNAKTVSPGLQAREVGMTEDVLRSLGSGAVQGVTGLAGLPAAVRDATGAYADWGRGVLGIKPPEDPNFLDKTADFLRGLPSALPNTQQIDTTVQDLTGQYHDPQSVPGEYAQTIGQFASGAAVPGGVGTKLASALVPALASETAGQVTRRVSPENEGLARLLGGVGGGLGVGGVTALRSGPENVIRSATKGVTGAQLDEAMQLRIRAQSLGVPLTQAEAVQQVTGGASGLGRVQRVVEGTSSQLAPMMAARPAQVRGAVDSLVNQIGPAVPPSEASRLGQSAAEGVINRMGQRVNESARPFYDRLPGQTLDPADAATLQANPSYARAQQEVMRDPELSGLLSGGPEDLSTVNRVIQQLDQMESAATPGIMNPQGNRTIASQRGQAGGMARDFASQASPDFATARQTVSTGREAFVDPLKRGPLGTIAGQPELRPTLSQQTGALFPNVPAEGQADQTIQAIRLMNEVEPGSGSALTRQFVATQANEALQDNMTGPNQFGGAKMMATLLGNPEQRRALLGAIDEAEPFNDARRISEVLSATGMREPVGSQTSFNAQLQQEISGGNLAQEAARAATNPGGIPGRVAQMFDNAMTKGNAERLAAFLMDDPEAARSAILQAQLNRSGGNRARLGIALSQDEDR